jgi:hypothetical protein
MGGRLGFLGGSLALIALYVVLQTGPASKLESGSNLIVNGLRRFLSSGVAGVPARHHGAANLPPPANPTTPGAPGGPDANI